MNEAYRKLLENELKFFAQEMEYMSKKKPIELAPLPKPEPVEFLATVLPQNTWYFDLYGDRIPEQGNTNMYPTPEKNKTTVNAAAATIVQAKSDQMIQREYLLEQLTATQSRWYDLPPEINQKLREQFNIDAPEYPTNPEAFIKAIKDGKYKLDTKRIEKIKLNAELEDDFDDEPVRKDDDYDPFRYSTPWSFITFTDLKKADHKSYQAAIEAYKADFQKTKNIIMVKSPEDGLEALIAFQNWKYKPTLH